MMKHTMKKTRLTGYILFYVLAALVIIPVVGAQGLDISVHNQSAATGSSFAVPVFLRNAEELSEVSLEISYDPAVLKFTGIDLGEVSQNGIIQATETGPGTIQVTVTDTSGISDDGEFMKLIFSVIGGEGRSSPVTIITRGLQNLDKNEVPAHATGGTVTVTGAGLKLPLARYITVIAPLLAAGIFLVRGRRAMR